MRQDLILRHLPSALASRLALPSGPPQNQFYVSQSQLWSVALPCDRQYFSPSVMPIPFDRFRPECLDTGYYLGFTDVMTPATIQDKVNEMHRRPTEPLLLENTSLEDQLPLQLVSMVSLYRESGSFWVPPQRNAPLTYAPIIDYIRSHYAPGPSAVGGRLRIWYPLPVPSGEAQP